MQSTNNRIENFTDESYINENYHAYTRDLRVFWTIYTGFYSENNEYKYKDITSVIQTFKFCYYYGVILKIFDPKYLQFNMDNDIDSFEKMTKRVKLLEEDLVRNKELNQLDYYMWISSDIFKNIITNNYPEFITIFYPSKSRILIPSTKEKKKLNPLTKEEKLVNNVINELKINDDKMLNKYSKLDTSNHTEKFTNYIINRIGITKNMKGDYPHSYNYFIDFLFAKYSGCGHKINYISNLEIKEMYIPKINAVELGLYSTYKNSNTIDKVPIHLCISKRNTPIPMRRMISPQIHEFKKSQKELVCDLCRSPKDIEVDHHSIAFRDIKDSFLRWLRESNIKEYPEHEDFEKLWKIYHKKYAKLRLLCQECHDKVDNRKSSKKIKY